MDNFLATFYIVLLLLWPSEPDWLTRYASDEDWQALKEISFATEICSPGVEHWRDDFKEEISWCRHAWETSRYLPPLAWSNFLPNHAECLAKEEFAKARLEFLSALPIRNGRCFQCVRNAVEDQAERVLVWGWMADATNPKRPAVRRRNCIAALVPYETSGGIPCHVNLAYYREGD